MNYIDDSVVIDFKVPRSVESMMEYCEKADREESYGAYNTLAESLVWSIAKEAYATGGITKKQWETIERRYPL